MAIRGCGIGRDPIAAGGNRSPAHRDLRLNEAVLAGTHNSFSAADSPDWLVASQRRTIERQLADGIRLFLTDPHWGAETGDGRATSGSATRCASWAPPAQPWSGRRPAKSREHASARVGRDHGREPGE